mmetsp:Transcript_20902/g.25884  ORF Transcript_20902/g.25884 Transcript_20902/m.25884 type:complete len:280 (+) Transcript_20902:872-1711(+)|eukprot:CAMPEP_0172493280 /NCGR_PEP_ID=MMETSP1066-20121228/24671_1 /TAXON_ID=671091 /ORGANISM="Coscinodiscus wailesii, Strain CCMP2513" /LENGTH=279 /DNA_ID=CAMNT_0013263365 /DNA_START=113 /DNA_END=952 /DNA_ORIENTATION=+
MEDYDDLAAGPDEDGQLNISYNSWRMMPDELFGFKKRLVKLNISHNKLEEISSQFGTLTLLQELDVSYNCITSLDPSIGHCIRLRHFDISHNQLTSLPPAVSQCVMLESVRCGNNKIESVPNDIGKLPTLYTLELQNNDLTYLPSVIGAIPTLKDIRCEGNTKLEMIPPALRSDAATIIWCLRLHKSYEDRIAANLASYREVKHRLRESAESNLRLQERVVALTARVKELEDERPYKYLAWKVRFLAKTATVREYVRRRFDGSRVVGGGRVDRVSDAES